jgi:hypothetical protein
MDNKRFVNKSRNNNRNILVRLFVVFIVIGIITFKVDNGFSISNQISHWAQVDRIPGSVEAFETPYLVTDEFGTIHAFYSQNFNNLETEVAIYYNKWLTDVGWSDKNDILLPPYRRQAHVQDVLIDKDGLIHLIFFGGDDRDANIYYTKAYASEAFNSRAWLDPILIGNNAITPRAASIVGDGISSLAVLYSGNFGLNGVYAIFSKDNGQSWSVPEPIFETMDLELKPFNIKLHRGGSDSIYAIWNIVDENGYGIEGYLIQLFIEYMDWSDPIIIAKGVGILGVVSLSVVEFEGKVFVIYDNGNPPSNPPVRWFIYSSDGGLEWTEPYRPFPDHVGGNGPPAFVIDNRDNLHVFFGQRVSQGGRDIHGMWHSTWDGKRWGQVEALIAGAQVSDPDGTNGFDPSVPKALLTNENILFVTWMNDPGVGRNGFFYSYYNFGSPIDRNKNLPDNHTNIGELKIIEIENFDVIPLNTNYHTSDYPDIIFVGNKKLVNPFIPLVIGVVLTVGFLFCISIRTYINFLRR